MPELPEVETIRRALAPVLEGRRVERLTITDPRWTESSGRPAHETEDAIGGRRVERLGRRGKYLVLTVEDDLHLVMHLRMTGTMLVDAPAGVLYSRAEFRLDDGRRIDFCDPRRFGTAELIAGTPALDEFFASRVGVEPLEDGALTGPVLRALARGRRAPVKAFLLDQRHVAGVGNIYADEALFAAGIHPLRPAGTLSARQCETLAGTVRAALEAGLAAGGATIDDFRHPDGVSGGFQNEFLIHLREGEPCTNCGRTVIKTVVAGRGTYVCTRCQPKPRARRRPVSPR